MLGHASLVAFAATTDSKTAIDFYSVVLGLSVRYEDDYALSLDAGGVELRLQKVENFTPHPFTALGWRVENLEAVLARLMEHGIVMERYPWMTQDDAGIWHAPSGAAVAWFKDPEGNLLSVAQYPAS